jgi:hypothetical protein
MNIPHPQRYFLGAGKLAALVKVQLRTSGLLTTANDCCSKPAPGSVSDARTLALTIAGPMACPIFKVSPVSRSGCFKWSLITFDSAKPHI